jgi:hypothetical protein
MAMDTSGSAAASHKAMFSHATSEIQSLPEQKDLYIFRFDSSPAEVFSEPPPARTEEITDVLNRLLKHRSGTEGTNIASLFVRMDKRIAQLDEPVRIIVYTDCGTERMTKRDEEQCQRITKRWDDEGRVESLTLIGVEGGYREKLIDIIQMSGSKFKFRD